MHCIDRLIRSHESAKTLPEVYWSIDNQNRVVLHHREGYKYTGAPGSTDVGDPFNFIALNDPPSQWYKTAPYGFWKLAIGQMFGLPTLAHPTRNAYCILRPTNYKLEVLHGA